jgi:tetratricopeptide (TPR) repeat protein/O-antigen ligase
VRLRERPEHFDWLELEDYLLVAAVVLLPWAFGGVEIWAYRGAAAVIAAAAGVAIAKRGIAALGLREKSRWLLPALLLGAWAAFQLVPLPPPILKILSPNADAIYERADPGYRGEAPDDVVAAFEEDALRRAEDVPELSGEWIEDQGFRADAGGRWSGWRSLSIRPDATIERLFWFVALLLAFLLVRARAAEPIRARVYRTALFASLAGMALFALLQAATWNGKMFWVRELPPQRSPFGPYVNFVHFAGAMEFAVPWIAGYTFAKFRRPEGDTLWRSIAPIALGLTFLCLIAGLAAPAKASAALMVTTFTCMAIVGFATLLRDRGLWSRRFKLALGGAVVLVWTSAALVISLTPLGERVRTFLAVRGAAPLEELHRLEVWSRSFSVIADYPVTGAGFGAFREVFVGYVPRGESRLWAQLHNDYLELAVDGGLVALALTAWLAVGFLARAFRGIRVSGRRVDLEYLGLLLAVLSLAVHANVDFNHQIPGTALLWVAGAALLVARGERLSSVETEATPAGWLRQPRFWAAAAVVVLFGFRAVSGGIAGISYPKALKLLDEGEYDTALPLLERSAVGFNRYDVLTVRSAVKGELWRARVSRPRDEEGLDELLRGGARDALTAAASNPVAALPWRSLARVYDWVERRAQGRSLHGLRRPDGAPVGAGSSGRIAVGLARRAIEASPNEFEYWDDLAMLLLGYGLRDEGLAAVRSSAEVQPAFKYHRYGLERDVPRYVLEEFAEASRRALDRAPLLNRREHLVSLGKLAHRLDDLERAEADFRAAIEEPGTVVDRAEARYWLGLTLTALGRLEEAEQELQRAAESAAMRRGAVVALADVAEQKGDLREALARLGEARRLQPRSLGYALRFADVARRLEEWPAATEALRWATVIQPTSEQAHVLLVELHLDTGDRSAARTTLAELERLTGETPQTRELRERLEEPVRRRK